MDFYESINLAEYQTECQEVRLLFRCSIGLYGPPREITGRAEVEIELSEEAGLTEVIGALRREIPRLEGRVISNGKDKLTGYYVFNINGRFYNDGMKIRIKREDKIALLPLVSGG
jgi:molybdopterin converting factor small subunit